MGLLLREQRGGNQRGHAPEPYATLVLLMEQTGLRIGEAFAGKRSDVKGNVIHVTRRILGRRRPSENEEGLPNAACLGGSETTDAQDLRW
jgi:integrase